jgi:hypothetical protein
LPKSPGFSKKLRPATRQPSNKRPRTRPQQRSKFFTTSLRGFCLELTCPVNVVVVARLRWPESISHFGVFSQILTFPAELKAQTWCVLRASSSCLLWCLQKH